MEKVFYSQSCSIFRVLLFTPVTLYGPSFRGNSLFYPSEADGVAAERKSGGLFKELSRRCGRCVQSGPDERSPSYIAFVPDVMSSRLLGGEL